MTSARPQPNIPVAIPAGSTASASRSAPPVPVRAGASAAPAPPSATSGRGGTISARTVAVQLLHGTPGRMRLLGALGVIAALLLGIVSINALLASRAAADRAANNTAQVVRIQTMHVDLLRADALATNAFLIGGAEPAEQRTQYDAALAAVARGLAEAAAAQPADGEALGALAEQVQDYSGRVQQARSTNRQGLPVGAQYLKEASAGLRADAIPVIETITEANEARAQAEFDRADSSRWLWGGVLTLLVLVGIAVWLARRTHRYLNASLTAAIALLGAALFAASATISSIGSTTASVARSDYRDAVVLADVRTAAYDARANESLTLIARGSGSAFESAWAANSARVGQGLDELSSAAKNQWAGYVAQHERIRQLDGSGSWEQAVALSGPGSEAAAAFTTFDERVTAQRDAASSGALSRLDGVGGSAPLWAILIGITSLVACWLIIRGVAQRIEEYK